MAVNIFSSIKKKNTSPYANAFSSNVQQAGTQPSYWKSVADASGITKMANTPFPSTPTPSPYSTPSTYKPTNVLDRFGQQVSQGQGITTLQNAKQKSFTPTYDYSQARSTSTTPTPPNTAMMSVPGQLAPSWGTPTPPTTPPATTSTVGADYLKTLQESGNAQAEFAKKQQQQNEDYQKAQYGLLNQGLDVSGQGYQDAFNRFKTNSTAGVADIRTTGDIQRSNAKDYYGDVQLQAAKSRNQVRGQTQQTFSNLGTLDSSGQGSFQQATENQDSAFNTFTQGNLKAQAQRMTEIDMAVGQAERQAVKAVQEEESKLNGLMQQIGLLKSQNNLDHAQGLIAAANQTQQRIYDIQDGINTIKYQYQLEQEKFKQKQNQLTQSVAGLSPEFMKTGEVKNMQDFIYRTKNPAMFDKMKSIDTAGVLQKSQETQDAIDLVDSIYGADLAPVTGTLSIQKNIPGSWAYDTARKIEQLKSTLQLASVGKLKGQGQVSDAERKILADSATTLDYGMGEPAFRAELSKVRDILSRSMQNGSSSTGSVNMMAPDGQMYSVSSSEEQTALQNGWKEL